MRSRIAFCAVVSTIGGFAILPAARHPRADAARSPPPAAAHTPRPGQQAPRFTANGYSFGYTLADRQSTDDQKNQKHWQRVEAPPGFEPGGEGFQTSALPLGDGAPGS